jgi:phosphoserine phosphatase
VSLTDTLVELIDIPSVIGNEDEITTAIAARLGIEHLIATVAEKTEHGYTGRIVGTPSYREGKVERLAEWLNANDETLENSWFYSDSHNDLPLLRKVDNPVAVDPDSALEREAREQGWPVISLR